MQRFFFDVHDGIEVQDASGLELPSLDDAKREALRLAKAIISNSDIPSEHGAVVVTVRDGSRSILAIVRLIHQTETV